MPDRPPNMRRLALLPALALVATILAVGCGGDDVAVIETLPPIRTTTTLATTTTTIDPRERFYIVQPGDNLSEIARRYEVTVASIIELNRLPSEVIQPGQELKIPNIRIDVTLPPLPASTDAP